MIIIAGAGHRQNEKYLLNEDKHCFHCNNTSRWILQKTRHFITLFFLPVAPYKTTYTLYCPICGNSIKLDKENYDQKKRSGSQPFK
ncbi:MAG: zinc ribbon domain-containing protein [Bacteroidetes bacterium]|nr:zinc ribbon domain-containing protein [Bacteroidota bacterium]